MVGADGAAADTGPPGVAVTPAGLAAPEPGEAATTVPAAGGTALRLTASART